MYTNGNASINEATRVNHRAKLVKSQMLWDGVAELTEAGGFYPTLVWWFGANNTLYKFDNSGGTTLLSEWYCGPIDNALGLDYCQIEMSFRIDTIEVFGAPADYADSPFNLLVDVLGDVECGEAVRADLGSSALEKPYNLEQFRKWRFTSMGYPGRNIASSVGVAYGYSTRVDHYHKIVRPGMYLGGSNFGDPPENGARVYTDFAIGFVGHGGLSISTVRYLYPLIALQFSSPDPPATTRMSLDMRIVANLYEAMQ